MNTDLALIQATLRAASVSRQDQLEPGDFKLCSHLTTEAEALAALTALDGTGWAWFAHTPGCVLISGHWSPGRNAGPLEYAERVSADGKRSLSITLEGNQWRITTATRLEHSRSEGGSFIAKHAYLQRGSHRWKARLHYEVLWRADHSGVLRPTASRFTGLDANANPKPQTP